MLKTCRHCGSVYDERDPDKTVSFGDLVYREPRTLTNIAKSKTVEISRKQAIILLSLMRSSQVSADAMVANHFHHNNDGAATFKVHIANLRKLLRSIDSKVEIANVYGYGYKFRNTLDGTGT